MTGARGEINCVNTGNFGAVAIIKSITVDYRGALGATSSGITVNAPDGPVRLRNLCRHRRNRERDRHSVQQRGGMHVENAIVSNFSAAPGMGEAPVRSGDQRRAASSCPTR